MDLQSSGMGAPWKSMCRLYSYMEPLGTALNLEYRWRLFPHASQSGTDLNRKALSSLESGRGAGGSNIFFRIPLHPTLRVQVLYQKLSTQTHVYDC